MNNHLSLLGILNIVWGIMGIIAALIVGAILVLPCVFAQMSHDSYYMRIPPEGCAALGIMGFVGALVTCLMMILFIPSVVGGIGLLLKKGWARILVIIVSIIYLLAFPLGTALGVYGLWVLWDKSKFDSVIAGPSKQANA